MASDNSKYNEVSNEDIGFYHDELDRLEDVRDALNALSKILVRQMDLSLDYARIRLPKR
jgi:hypothetical protein